MSERAQRPATARSSMPPQTRTERGAAAVDAATWTVSEYAIRPSVTTGQIVAEHKISRGSSTAAAGCRATVSRRMALTRLAILSKSSRRMAQTVAPKRCTQAAGGRMKRGDCNTTIERSFKRSSSVRLLSSPRVNAASEVATFFAPTSKVSGDGGSPVGASPPSRASQLAARTTTLDGPSDRARRCGTAALSARHSR